MKRAYKRSAAKAFNISPYLQLPNKRRRLVKKPQNAMKVAMTKKLKDGTTEIKYIDEVGTVIGVPSTGRITLLNQIDQGFEAIDRVGAAIYMLKVHLKFFINVGTGTQILQQTRVLIVQDKQQVDSTNPSLSALFEGGISVVALINYKNKKRWRILYDKYISLSFPGEMTENHQITVPINDEAYFSGSVGTSISRNGVYLIIVSDNASGTPADSSNLRYTARLTYTDK